MSSLLSLGIQAVRANQAGLAVTGNNIANVNTPGYTRQVPHFQSREGGGVYQESSQRMVNQFINARVWADSSRFEASKAFEQLANQLDNTLASESTSLSYKMDDFFAAMQAANDDPTSITNRELLVAETQATQRRFRDLYDQIAQQNETINTRIRELTQEINSQARNIADLNERIRIAKAGGKEAFELLDQRDQSIKALSELIDISVIEQSTGESTIFIANGQPLVVGQSVNTLVPSTNELDSSQVDVSLILAGRENNLTNYIGGGELGGLLEYRKDVMNQSLDELGRLSLVFADTMNKQHQLGMDLDGNMGQQMFRDINDSVLMNARFQAQFVEGSVKITDTSKLQASEYELVFISEDDFRLTRLADGKTWSKSDFDNQVARSDVVGEKQLFLDVNEGELTLQIDGFQITADTPTNFSTNERMLIQPTRTAADDMRVDIINGRQLALASPVTVEKNSGNQGTANASISLDQLTQPFAMDPRDALSGIMPSPATLVLEKTADTPPTYALSPDTSPSVIAEVDPDDPRNIIIRNNEVPPLSGQMTVRLEGQAEVGDTFNINFNFDLDTNGDITNVGVSDNRNGLHLTDLTKTNTSIEGTYQNTYGRLVERVGITTKIAQMDTRASESVLRNSINQREEISGVNLDEEAVKLIQFQQAYQAAAQLITASQRTFDALISAI